MKLLLVGHTGSIGSALLHQCLSNEAVSCLVILSRRPLHPAARDLDKRIRIMVVDSFTVYDGDVLQEIEGAVGCIWCLGHSKLQDSGDSRKTSTDSTVAAASAFASYIAALPKPSGKAPFRFVCLNSMFPEGEQRRGFSLITGSHRMKGDVEQQLLALSKRSGNRFEAYIARPAFVLRPESRCPKLLLPMMSGIRVDALASCMLDCVVHGNPKTIIDHRELVDAGKMLLADMG